MSKQVIGVVQSHGKSVTEDFDRTKLYDSVRTAMLTSHSREGEADSTAEKVCEAVMIWLDGKTQVTSNDIRRIAAKYLYKYHTDAAYLYEHHRHTI